MRAAGLVAALVALVGCGGSGVAGRGADADVDVDVDVDVGADVDVDVDVDVGADVGVLEAGAGLAAWLVGVELEAAAPGPLRFVVRVEADGLAFTLGRGATFRRVPAPGDSELPVLERQDPFVIAPGERLELHPPDDPADDPAAAPLLAWVPGASELALRLSAVAPDGALLTASSMTFATGSTVEQVGPGPLRLRVRASADAVALDPATRVGLTLDGALEPAELAERVGGNLALKVYAGARRWLLRPGCDSDAACAPGASNHPCVSTCACRCDDAACDCDFADLEADMEASAWAAARRLVGADASASELARVRLHWVFKRSLGGTASCDVSGELDVTPETYGRFFAAATGAALRINTRAGFRLVDLLSPMNEANHPLQDGAHVNAAGQPTLGGFLDFGELIRQSSCQAGRCCARDRYIVDAPDVPALLAAAMASAQAVIADADPVLAPIVALSLYLDSEQVDPLQVDGEGFPPAIVTPVSPFAAALAAALAGRAFAHDVIVVDTYPGSWGAPWFETEDRIVHHMDPASQRIWRVDPVVAADQAVARAMRARADFTAVFDKDLDGPEVVLGEVGWSTFDGDEAAQARFALRLFDAAAAERARDPAFGGFLWFKTRDREPFAYPSWSEAPNPLGGDPVACDTELLGPIVCAADVLARMEGQWGLRRVDGAPKPAWEAFVARWVRHSPYR